ncbi:MAG: 50S ribosomal protein L9 [bacterium]
MKVYMLKDVVNIGMAGTMINVSDGYAKNFLFPRKLAVQVTAENASSFKVKIEAVKQKGEIINSKVAMLAEKIKALHLTIKEKTHDDGKLYGSVGPDEIVELLKKSEIIVNRKQIEFDKSVKATGEHKVTVRLSSKLKPQFILKVTALSK